ncbi:MAG TPA: hypothetical protein VJH20_03370 [Candidatus Nanoarchaeia archaeon]|nr:hypothetical protein [Candidatus Nanoarchaeia archaeon]
MNLTSKIRNYYRPIYRTGKVGDTVVYMDMQFPEGQKPGYFRYIIKSKYCRVVSINEDHKNPSITLRNENGKHFTTGFPNMDIRQPGFLELLIMGFKKL